jgi:hypothetical protein
MIMIQDSAMWGAGRLGVKIRRQGGTGQPNP